MSQRNWAIIVLSLIAGTAPARTVEDFDFDWRFKAGEVEDGQAPALDDKAWERVDLPHDFMIEGKGQAIVVPGGRTGGAARRLSRRSPKAPSIHDRRAPTPHRD